MSESGSQFYPSILTFEILELGKMGKMDQSAYLPGPRAVFHQKVGPPSQKAGVRYPLF
jgi:hypothetical protein